MVAHSFHTSRAELSTPQYLAEYVATVAVNWTASAAKQYALPCGRLADEVRRIVRASGARPDGDFRVEAERPRPRCAAGKRARCTNGVRRVAALDPVHQRLHQSLRRGSSSRSSTCAPAPCHRTRPRPACQSRPSDVRSDRRNRSGARCSADLATACRRSGRRPRVPCLMRRRHSRGPAPRVAPSGCRNSPAALASVTATRSRRLALHRKRLCSH